MEDVLRKTFQSIVDGDQKTTSAMVQEALNHGLDPSVILNEGMTSAMVEVGRLFEEGEYFIPEMLISARAMQSGLALLKPHLIKADLKNRGKVIVGTVQGDLHDIGKNLVGMMFEGAAFEVIDLGSDVAPEKFVQAVKNNNADLIAMSALLTTTMINMRSTIEALKSAGVRGQIKVMVGGAPLTQKYADEIGADGYAPDASRAVALAKSLVGEMKK